VGRGLAETEGFAGEVERYRGELRVHCYRMLGSIEEAEDLVQETFLRAWRGREAFEGRSSVRAWLYRIATNACLDFLGRRAGRVLPYDADPVGGEIAWLEPYPSAEDAVVAREGMELAFLAAIQHLPARQRAALILRDVLGWSALETAAVLGSSGPAVHSAVRRARATLRERLPRDRAEWRAVAPSPAELGVLRRYMAAVEAADLHALAELLAEDVRTSMPPIREWYAGRPAVLAALGASWDPRAPGYVGRFRMVGTVANGQPAAAAYTRVGDVGAYRPFALGVLGVRDGRIAEIVAFHDAALFARFGLPAELTDESG
jgi:RNA polymerase sigma-70 factor, ECF subfamily